MLWGYFILKHLVDKKVVFNWIYDLFTLTGGRTDKISGGSENHQRKDQRGGGRVAKQPTQLEIKTKAKQK